MACGAISKADGRALRATVLRGARGSGANAGAGAEMNGDGMHAICLWKWRKGVVGGGGYMPVPVGALEGPDGIRVKSMVIIKDSDLGLCHFHLIVDTTTSYSLTLINIQYQIIHRNT